MSKHTTFIIHGSKKPEYRDFIMALINRVGDAQSVNVGFFEMLEPNIPTAIAEHIQNGATEVRLLPLFLGPGKHVMTDIPEIVAKAQTEHPNVKLILENFLGMQTEVEELLRRWVEA